MQAILSEEEYNAYLDLVGKAAKQQQTIDHAVAAALRELAESVPALPSYRGSDIRGILIMAARQREERLPSAKETPTVPAVGRGD